MSDFPVSSEWLIFLGILLLTLLVGFLFRRFYFRLVRRSTTWLNNDPTGYRFLGHLITAIIYVIGVSWAIATLPDLRNIANSLLAGAGIVAVAIGFASQQVLSNIISGLFIIIFRPFRINDRLTIQGTMEGVVEDITLRHTVIRNYENRRIIIPNSIISDEVIVNSDMTDPRVCRFIEVSISYGSDIRHAKEVMHAVVSAHPLRIDGRTPDMIAEGVEEIPVRVMDLQDSGILLRANAWAQDLSDGFVMRTELLQQIKEAFDDAGIEIPFPHRKLILDRSDEQPSSI